MVCMYLLFTYINYTKRIQGDDSWNNFAKKTY